MQILPGYQERSLAELHEGLGATHNDFRTKT